MSWLAVPFPPRIAFGIQCDPGWEVRVVTTKAGFESRNLEWSATRHSYDASLAIRDETDYRIVLDHFHMARGKFHSWPLRDPLDYRCDQSSGVIALDGDDSPQSSQLFKRYGSGEFAYDRKITRLKAGAVVIYRNGVPSVEGTHYTLDDDTGAISYPGADPDELSWSGQFWVPCRYDVKSLPAQVLDRRGAHGELLVGVDSIAIVEVRE